jgi:hypothetical protein
LLDLLFDPEDGGSNFPQNVDEVLPEFTAQNPRKYLTANGVRISNVT